MQKIFYLHVPSAWTALLASGSLLIASLGYLITERSVWNKAAHASAEIGTLFCAAALFSGSLWAKSVWNAWWARDLRLMTTFMLWLTFLGYVLFQRTGRPRYAAAFGIIAFLNVPCLCVSTCRWRTLHPGPVITLKTEGAMASEMSLILLICLTAFFGLFLDLFQQRVPLALMADEIEGIRSQGLHVVATRSIPQGGRVENQNFIIEAYRIEEK